MSHLMGCAIVGTLLVAPGVLGAQWRAEASVAAGRAQLPGHAAAPSPTTGSIAGGIAREVGARGAWRVELAGDGGHESFGGFGGGDLRAVARLAWSRRGNMGLTVEGGSSAAWRSIVGIEQPLANPLDTTLMLRVDSSRRVSPAAPRVLGATGGVGAWARARGVLFTANARTTSIGSITESWQETRFRLEDSLVVRPHFDSLAQKWVFDTLGTQTISVPYLATGQRVRRLLQTDFTVGAMSSRGALGFAFVGGVRRATLGDGGDGWGSARATWALRGDLALTVQAARLARDAQRQLPGRRELQLGVLLKPWGARSVPVSVPSAAATRAWTFSARRVDDDHVTIVVATSGARSVELMGDFTGWRVVALERTRGDTWQVTLALPRGVHQVNVRIDGGAWLPPPGLGVGDDGFGGTFGLLVL